MILRAAEQFAENMVTNNAILWEINEIVGNLRPELSTHIRLIMLRAGFCHDFITIFVTLSLTLFVLDYLKCWQTETTLQKYKRAEDVRVKFNVIKKLVDSNPSYATLFESLKDIVSFTDLEKPVQFLMPAQNRRCMSPSYLDEKMTRF